MFHRFHALVIPETIKRLLIALGVVIVAIGCGGGGPLTVEEYGRVVCPHMGTQFDVEDPTWGDVARFGDDLRGKFDVTPPGALRQYHEANVAIMDAWTDFAEEQPSNELTDVDGWYEILEAVESPTEKLERVVENLEPGLRTVLIEHGCSV